MFILNTCGSSSMMHSILFIKNIINIIFVVVPIVLALLFTVDLAKNVFAKDNQENQKNLKLGIRRIIYSLVLLFVPLLVETFMGMISGYSKVASCYELASEAKVKELYAKEEVYYNEQQAQQLQDKINQANEVSAEHEAENSAAQKAEQNAQNSSSNSNTSVNNDIESATTAEKIASLAESWSWPLGTSESKFDVHTGKPYNSEFSSKYKKYWNPSKDTKLNQRVGACCCHYVKTVVREVIGKEKWGNTKRGLLYEPNAAYKKRLNKMGFTLFKFDGKKSSLKRGDMGIYYKKSGGGHIYIYLGNGLVSEAASSASGKSGKYARITKWKSQKSKLNNKNWYYIIRAKE